MISITVFVPVFFEVDSWKGIPGRGTAWPAGMLTELTARAQKAIRDALRAAAHDPRSAVVIFHWPHGGFVCAPSAICFATSIVRATHAVGDFIAALPWLCPTSLGFECTGRNPLRMRRKAVCFAKCVGAASVPFRQPASNVLARLHQQFSSYHAWLTKFAPEPRLDVPNVAAARGFGHLLGRNVDVETDCICQRRALRRGTKKKSWGERRVTSDVPSLT